MMEEQQRQNTMVSLLTWLTWLTWLTRCLSGDRKQQQILQNHLDSDRSQANICWFWLPVIPLLLPYV